MTKQEYTERAKTLDLTKGKAREEVIIAANSESKWAANCAARSIIRDIVMNDPKGDGYFDEDMDDTWENLYNATKKLLQATSMDMDEKSRYLIEVEGLAGGNDWDETIEAAARIISISNEQRRRVYHNRAVDEKTEEAKKILTERIKAIIEMSKELK